MYFQTKFEIIENLLRNFYNKDFLVGGRPRMDPPPAAGRNGLGPN